MSHRLSTFSTPLLQVGDAPANALPIGGAKVQVSKCRVLLDSDCLPVQANSVLADLVTLVVLQISGTAKGGNLFQFTVQASGETYELAATTQQERRRSGAVPQRASLAVARDRGMVVGRRTIGWAEGTCARIIYVCRWVDQLLQAASKQTAAMQSPPGIVTDGHLLAPSPLGVGLPQIAFQEISNHILLTRPQCSSSAFSLLGEAPASRGKSAAVCASWMLQVRC